MSLRELALVGFGGAAGAIARYSASLACTSLLGERFPWGTLFVNVVGCFVLGWLSQTTSISDATKLAVGTGFLGAFTTFSTFGVQTVQTWERSPLLALGNILSNVAIGLAAAVIGIYAAKTWMK